MKKIIPKIVAFFAGILAGAVGLIIAIVLELVLSVFGKPPMTLAKDPLFLIALLVPAFLEEITKTAIANRLLNRWGTLWIVAGTGLGFGLAETYLAQSAILFNFSSALLPLVHSIFLIGGYLLTKWLAKENKYFYFEWLLASVLLHWGYNVAQVIFLLKP